MGAGRRSSVRTAARALRTAARTRRSRTQAYITTQQTYVVRCPACLGSRQFRVSAIPPERPNPFEYECQACGALSAVQLVGFRASTRRRVKLAATFSREEMPRVVREGTIVDLSPTGARLIAEPFKVAPADVLQLVMILNDDGRSPVQVRARVRRMSQEGKLLTVALEFLALKPEHRYLLDHYLGQR